MLQLRAGLAIYPGKKVPPVIGRKAPVKHVYRNSIGLKGEILIAQDAVLPGRTVSAEGGYDRAYFPPGQLLLYWGGEPLLNVANFGRATKNVELFSSVLLARFPPK